MKKINTLGIVVGALLLLTTPMIAAAQLMETDLLVNNFGVILNMLLWVFATLALLVFFWGIIKYIASAGNAEKASEGKSIMIYGAIALFVLFSIFGIIQFLRGEFLISQQGSLSNPQVLPPRY